MNFKLFNPDYLSSLCQKYGLRPSKKYGQNFLIDSAPIEKMIEAAEISKEDTVVEVGPGFGVLTFALAKRAGRVVAFEIEKKIKPYWDEILMSHSKRNEAERRISGDFENVEIVWGNILLSLRAKRSNPKDNSIKPLGSESNGIASVASLTRNDKCKVVANLPYQITSNVIRKFLEADNPPEMMVLMVQKEVAERVCAKPGEMSLLAVAVQYYASTEIIAQVPRASFWPEPAVDSAIVSLRAKRRARLWLGSNLMDDTTKPFGSETGGIAAPAARARNDIFFKVARAGFAQRRKFLIKNLEPLVKNKSVLKEIFKKIGLDEKIRAQELSLEQWKKMVEHL